MMVAAASDAQGQRGPCKGCANCLKPKEIAQTSLCFDLRSASNYLKVKMIGEGRITKRSGFPRRYDGHDA
jgi:hypothetical protein